MQANWRGVSRAPAEENRRGKKRKTDKRGRERGERRMTETEKREKEMRAE